MTTATLFILLLGVYSTLAASIPVDEEANLPVEEEPAVDNYPVFYQRLKRAPVHSYSSGAYSGAGAGSYAGNGFGNGGYFGSYSGNYPPNFPNFPAPVFFPMPYAGPRPFDVNELFNAYFNAFQNFQNFALGNRIDGNIPGMGSRQASLSQLASDTRRALQQAMCRVLQRLQLPWADTSSACSNQQGVFVSSSGSNPGGTQISVSAPPGAHVEHFQGPGGLQGVSVSHQSFGPGGSSAGISSVSGGGSYGGVFSSSSSSSSNINGHTNSYHSSTTGVNNNGHVSSVTLTKP